jgi:hypothetical protein
MADRNAYGEEKLVPAAPQIVAFLPSNKKIAALL